MRTIHFFLDFDGTISDSDVVDLVLEKFADEKWKEVEKEWVEGKIGSRECLTRQIALVKAKPEEVISLVQKVSIDPYFVKFLHKAEELGVLVTIVSDGFDFFIEQILKKNLKEEDYLKALPIFSNRLEPKDGGFKPFFATEEPCEHGCANCKPAVMKRLSSAGDNIFFVGDGLSDRFAAKASQMTFAKSKLLEFCKAHNLDHIAYDDFKKVTEWLTDNHMLLKKASFGNG